MQPDQNTDHMEDLLKIDNDSFTTIIDDGIEITGVIRCNSGKAILISGTFLGDIVSNGTVVINQSGRVMGSISARTIKLAGSIEEPDGVICNVFAEEAMVIAKTASMKVTSLTYGGIDMELGASLTVSGAMRTLSRGMQDAREKIGMPGVSYLNTLATEASVDAKFPSFASNFGG